MNVKDTVRRMLMLYPGVNINALDVYEHMFCVIGNGFEWENGELVEHGEFSCSDAVPTMKDAVDKALQFKLLHNPSTGIEAAMFRLHIDEDNEDSIKNCIEELFKWTYNSINEDISLIFRTDERANDFEPHTAKRYPEVRHIWPVQIYELCEYSKLCCLPDDIKPDWLDASEWMYNFVKSHPELWFENQHEVYEKWLEKVDERIRELRLKSNEQEKTSGERESHHKNSRRDSSIRNTRTW